MTAVSLWNLCSPYRRFTTRRSQGNDLPVNPTARISTFTSIRNNGSNPMCKMLRRSQLTAKTFGISKQRLKPRT